MRRSITVGFVILALTAAATAWYLTRPQRPQAVFLIVVDTLRADRLSCYGYNGHDTPHIDALAALGVQFDHAIAVGGWTVPSMGAMMTSLYPTQLGLVEAPKPRQRFFKVRERREQIAHTVADRFVTMPETFLDAGYHTAAFVNQPVLTNQDGFWQGFAEGFCVMSADSVLRFEPDDDRGYDRAFMSDDVYGYRADSTLVETFAQWLPTAPSEDLFVWIHLLSPHWPYEPPARYGVPTDSAPSRHYDGEVRYTDDMIGRVVAAIDGHVGLDNALIVFTSDHGEEFGERGSKDHGHSLHRECVHVPLLMSGPGIGAGRREARHVGLIDVFPTLADRCGLDLPVDAQGVDLLSGSGNGRPVYSEGMLYGSSERSFIDGGVRIMWEEQDDRYRLFDLAADADERRDLAQERSHDVARLRDTMVSLHDRLFRDFAEQAATDSLKSAQERERALKAMRSLGYVND